MSLERVHTTAPAQGWNCKPLLHVRSLCAAQRFGIELDEAKNLDAVAKEAAIHSERSAVQVRVISRAGASEVPMLACNNYTREEQQEV